MIIDLIFALILVICVWIGSKRGFVKTAMGVVSLFIGLIAAIYLYQPFIAMLSASPMTADIMVQIKTGIQNAIMPMIAKNSQAQVPVFFHSFISNEIVNQGNLAIANAVSELVFSAALMILFILVIKIGIALCIRVMGVVTKLPIIKQLNALLGGALGGVNGIIFCFIAATILFILASYPQNAWITDNLPHSYLARYFYDNNILIKLIRPS